MICRKVVIAAVALLEMAVAQEVYAQGVPLPDSDVLMVSAENVDPISGNLAFNVIDFMIGGDDDPMPIKFERTYRSPGYGVTTNIDPFGLGWSHSYIMGAYYTAGPIGSNGHSMVVIIGPKQYRFSATLIGGAWSYSPLEMHGGMAESQVIAGTTTTVFKSEDGYRYYFPQDTAHAVSNWQDEGMGAFQVLTAMVDKVVAPNEEEVKFYYSKTASEQSIRLDGLKHSRGYGVLLKYISNLSGDNREAGRQTINKIVIADYICPTFPYGCSESSFRNIIYDYNLSVPGVYNLSSVTNVSGERTRYEYEHDPYSIKDYLSKIYTPADTVMSSIEFGYGNAAWGLIHRVVTSVSLVGKTTTFAYPSDIYGACPQTPQTTKTDPSGAITRFKYMVMLEGEPDGYMWCAARAVSEIVDQNGGVIKYRYTNDYFETMWPQWGGRNQLTRIINPEGDYYSNTVDYRGNIVSQSNTPKPNSGLPATLISASFPECTATNFKHCNKPTYEIDANGGRTDYIWSDDHGGLLSVQRPAGVDGIRPETRYQYTMYAGLDGVNFYLASRRTDKVNASEYVDTNFQYAPSNRFRLREKTVTSGSAALRTCYGYDDKGRRISETAPSANLTICP